MKRGAKPQGDQAMTAAQRQARYRASRQTAAPAIRYRKPADHRSRPQRWKDAVAELIDLQAGYQEWLDGMPENLQGTPTADALQAICDLDLSELEGTEPPRGFGRDG